MQQYYAHPQNTFWKLISRIYDAEVSLTYNQRVEILTANQIALWDVLPRLSGPAVSTVRSSMHRYSANDFAAFFRAHPQIRRVYFNGRKAEEMYRRLVWPGLSAEFVGIRYVSLPSTSPAHAGMTFAEKLVRWRTIKERSP